MANLKLLYHMIRVNFANTFTARVKSLESLKYFKSIIPILFILTAATGIRPNLTDIRQILQAVSQIQ